MNRKHRKLSINSFKCIILISLLCLGTAGCMPESPVPPSDKTPVPSKVAVSVEQIYAPYPTSNGTIPSQHVGAWNCDHIRFIRFRPTDDIGDPKPVNAVLVLIPGYLGGANSFDYLGRQIVSMAEADSDPKSLEVWAIERRGNCLEDLTGLNAAEVAEDPGIAIDYYYNGLELAGHTFQGFLKDEDMPYLSEFGLKLLMDDIYTIITTKIPDQNERNTKVFIGGHSMGGSFTSFFAGWDMDGNPATLNDAGYNNCAGLIGLDGRVGPRTISSMDKADYEGSLSDIRTGNASRLNLFGIDSIGGVTPESLALFEVLGLYAHMDPKAEGTWFKNVPFSKEVDDMIKLLHSKDLAQFLSGSPSIKKYRYTNEALLGIIFDDNFNPAPFMQVSMGFLHGGTVFQKTFPGYLAEKLGMSGMVTSEGMFIAGNSDGALYEWVNFDEVGNASDPDYKDTLGLFTYTTWKDEMSDIQDVALSLYRGGTNFPEWYFTSRVSLDTSAASAAWATTPPSPGDEDLGLYFYHSDQVDDIPMLNIYASEIEGYNHLDVLFAAVDRPGHRENEVFEPMMDFIFSIVDDDPVTFGAP